MRPKETTAAVGAGRVADAQPPSGAGARRPPRRAWAATAGLLAAAGLALAATGCQAWPAGPGTKSKPQLQYRVNVLPEMYEGPPVQPQSVDPLDHDAPEMRPVPPGTVPYHWVFYPTGNDLAHADQMINPLPNTMPILKAGRYWFNTYCIVCHGPRANGYGYIVPHMTQPPALFDPQIMKFSDGKIFTIISQGFGQMPSYRTELDPAQRWAIVHYVRVLQFAAHPTPQALAQAERQGLNFASDYPRAEGPNGPIPGQDAVAHNPGSEQ